MTLNNKIIGDIGENCGSVYLQNRGYAIIARNYRKPWGELDIVAVKDDIYHFFEVKSVVIDPYRAITSYKPEENVHGLKVSHIRRMVRTFLQEFGSGLGSAFSVHVLCVYLNMFTRTARIKWIHDVII